MAHRNGTRYLAPAGDEAFNALYLPGQPTPHSGIYRCRSCQRAIASLAGDPLPPEDHHPHSITQGAVRWQLAVKAPVR
jgi:hypothetical protein